MPDSSRCLFLKDQTWFWTMFTRGLQGDVVYLGWPIAPSYIESKMRGGWGGGCGVSANEYSSAHPVTRSPNKLWMRSSLVVRASDCQCTSCNGPGFDPSIRRHSGIWGAADEAVLNIVRTKRKKSPKKILNFGDQTPYLTYDVNELIVYFSVMMMISQTGGWWWAAGGGWRAWQRRGRSRGGQTPGRQPRRRGGGALGSSLASPHRFLCVLHVLHAGPSLLLLRPIRYPYRTACLIFIANGPVNHSFQCCGSMKFWNGSGSGFRIRIRGSIPLTNGSGSCCFRL